MGVPLEQPDTVEADTSVHLLPEHSSYVCLLYTATHPKGI